MIREIKFRAWDKRLSEMLYDVSVYADGMIGLSDIAYRDVVEKKIGRELWDDEIHQFDEEGNTKLIGTVLCGEDWYWLEKDEFELMQYTGLKDKNGKEIYEGDKFGDAIVKYGKHKFKTFMNGDLSGARTHVGFYLSIPSHDLILKDGQVIHYQEEIQDLYKAENYEITGNIYENPELL